MKSCKDCGQSKPVSEFYVGANSCKSCYCARVRANRASRAEQYRAYDRNRNMRQDRVSARKLHRLTAAGKAQRQVEQARERSIRGDAYLARNAANNALRDGKISRKPCVTCGSFPAEKHHPDYRKPLDVVWLCAKHHTAVHRNDRSVGQYDVDRDPIRFGAMRD